MGEHAIFKEKYEKLMTFNNLGISQRITGQMSMILSECQKDKGWVHPLDEKT